MIGTLWRGLQTPQIRRNAVRISAVVGTILNLINQSPALFGDARISWPHVALNYVVPFLVASYSAAKNAPPPAP